MTDDEVDISRSAAAMVNPGVVVLRREAIIRAEEHRMALVPARRDIMGFRLTIARSGPSAADERGDMILSKS